MKEKRLTILDALRKIMITVCVCTYSLSLFAQQGTTVTGVITDEKGEAIIGAGVVEKGTTNGSITDMNGKFSLDVPNNAVLQVSYLGYVTQDVPVGGQTNLNITLKENNLALDEVVVVGYGTSSKRKMTAAISTVPVERIENLPSMSVVNNLGGTTPGIIVTQEAGGPNNFAEISIRQGGRAIVVIDGVVTDYVNFRNMNPLDIESINILKDAASGAIYGSRAGDGIILVTTKKGADRPLSISYTGSYSLSSPTILQKSLGSYDLAYYKNMAYENDGYGPYYTDTPEVMEKYRTGSDPYYYPSTDWYKMTLHDYAPEASHNLSLNGGNRKNSYYASLGYYDQGALYHSNITDSKRYNVRLNMVNNFENIGLKTTTGISGDFYNYHDIASDPSSSWDAKAFWGHLYYATPMNLAVTDKGHYAVSNGYNPYTELAPERGYADYNTNSMTGLFNAEWTVPYVKGVVLKSISHYRMDFGNEKLWIGVTPTYEVGSDVPQATNSTGSLRESYVNGKSYTQQFLADYAREFENGITVGALLGHEFFSYFGSQMSGSRTGYTLLVDQFFAGPTPDMNISGGESEEGRAAYLGRLKADYKSKYLLEASFRHDGSDWFPKGKRWGTFYSFSSAWALSEEAFMASLKESGAIDLLKLRGSYGTVGLDGAGAGLSRFGYVPGYSLNQDVYVINGAMKNGFSEGSLPSPDITWYTVTSTNAALDFSILNRSLFGTFELFKYRTTGYLASQSKITYTGPLGTELPIRNSEGAFRRMGYEGSLGYRNSIGDFKYEVSGNFTYADMLWEMNPGEDEATLKNPTQRVTHQPYASFGLMYKSLGFFTDMDDVLNSPKPAESTNLRPGDIKYADLNGDGIIDANDRRRLGHSTQPRVQYGINFDLKYRGLFLNALILGTSARDVYLPDGVRGDTEQTKGYMVRFPYQTDFWTEDNPNALYPRLVSHPTYNGKNNYLYSDFWLADATYIRLKSLQLGYDFKHSLLKGLNFLSSAKVILSGTNLFTLSPVLKYDIDPESTTNFWYPIQRVYSVSLNLEF